MELLKSTVTLLNTCEKLKVMHETQCEKKAKGQRPMRLVIVCVIVNMLKCGSGCGTDRIHGTNMGIKCVILMSFSPLFYVSMFSIYVSL